MKNKRFLLGMLVIALAFGMTVVGCEPEDEDYPAELKVTNSSTTDITLVEFTKSGGAVVKSDREKIPAGQSRTYEFESEFSGTVKVQLSPLGVPLVEATSDGVSLKPGYREGHSTQPATKKELIVSGDVLSGFKLSLN